MASERTLTSRDRLVIGREDAPRFHAGAATRFAGVGAEEGGKGGGRGELAHVPPRHPRGRIPRQTLTEDEAMRIGGVAE